MIENGVQHVIDKYEYKCTNDMDSTLVIGWLEIHIILHKLVPDTGRKQWLFDWINRPTVGSIFDPETGLTIDKAKGVISYDGTDYAFNPVFHLTSSA